MKARTHTNTSTLTNTFIPLKFRADYPFYGRAAVEVIFGGTFMRPRSGQSDLFTSTFITSLSRVRASRRVVAIVLVEVAGTLLVVVLLPRGGVRSVEVLDLLAIILVEHRSRCSAVGGRSVAGPWTLDARWTRHARTRRSAALKPLVCNNWTFLWLLCGGHEF